MHLHKREMQKGRVVCLSLSSLFLLRIADHLGQFCRRRHDAIKVVKGCNTKIFDLFVHHTEPSFIVLIFPLGCVLFVYKELKEIKVLLGSVMPE